MCVVMLRNSFVQNFESDTEWHLFNELCKSVLSASFIKIYQHNMKGVNILFELCVLLCAFASQNIKINSLQRKSSKTFSH